MSYTETILLGVPSGIVSALIVWLSITTWSNVVTPWIRKQIYRGVEVTGEWTSVLMTDEDDIRVDDISKAFKTMSYSLTIERQYGHVLKGCFFQSYKSQDSESQGRYRFKGQIMDGVVMLSLEPEVKSKSTFGTLLMYVTSAGGELNGMFTFKGAKSNMIKTTDLILKKRI
ncbi:hypothetical protein [Shewanella acanthi]|uniref:hypothetical protein n=1 Tax=Shewanella acanthi TaxID=2864212 RepID=UPI001C65D2AD|nr:hypothetical protein [Shewanella acanthi]QYJ77922.1 hypothetical protein K0H61_12430 [Shewanella acanthi]